MPFVSNLSYDNKAREKREVQSFQANSFGTPGTSDPLSPRNAWYEWDVLFR